MTTNVEKKTAKNFNGFLVVFADPHLGRFQVKNQPVYLKTSHPEGGGGLKKGLCVSILEKTHAPTTCVEYKKSATDHTDTKIISHL